MLIKHNKYLSILKYDICLLEYSMSFEYSFKNIDEVLSNIDDMSYDEDTLLLDFLTDIFDIEGDDEGETF